METTIRNPVTQSKPGASRYYRPELDVIRFVAFLLVFVHHELPAEADPRAALTLKGFAPILYATSNACAFGLSLFFTLSAFLICELLLRERETTGTVGVKQFYIRRILRIWPLYYLGIAAGACCGLLDLSHRGDLPYVGWFAIFMGGWYASIHGGSRSPIASLWSISVEEQFYLFAPWIVKRLNRNSLFGFCGLLILVANTVLYSLGKMKTFDFSLWFNSFVEFEFFAAGILLCLCLRGRLPTISLWHRLMLVAGTWCCWFFVAYVLHVGNSLAVNPGSWHVIAGYALGALGCVSLIVAFLGASQSLLPRWAIYLGRISYGLYVFHGIAAYVTSKLLIGHVASFKSPLFLLKGALALGLTILMAALSYRFLEMPFLRMKKRHAAIDSQPVADAALYICAA